MDSASEVWCLSTVDACAPILITPSLSASAFRESADTRREQLAHGKAKEVCDFPEVADPDASVSVERLTNP